MRRPISLFSGLFALLAGACATTRQAAPVFHAPGPTAPRSECSAVSGRPAYALDLADPLENQVLALSCYDAFERAPEVPQRAYVKLHARFDDRHFDPLTAAIMVVACAGDGACQGGVEPESLGQMVFYAQSVQAAQLKKALQPLPLSAAIRTTFLERFEASRTSVLREAKELDERHRDLFVEVPKGVRAREQAHFKTFQTFYQRLDKLLPKVDPAIQKGAAPKVLAQLTTETAKLRDEFLAKCAANKTRTALECLTGPIARPLTYRLVQLAILQGNGVLGQAENALLRLGPDQSSAAAQIASALTAAIEEEQAQMERYAQAKEEGVDEVTLEAAYGVPPPIDVSAMTWELPHDLAGFRAQLRNLQPATDTVRGTVRATKAKGDSVEVLFEDEQVGGDCGQQMPENLGDSDPGDCSAEGGRKVPVEHVFLPAADAKPLKAGNRLEAVVDHDTRKGLAVKVFKTRTGDQLVQLRAVRWRQ